MTGAAKRALAMMSGMVVDEDALRVMKTLGLEELQWVEGEQRKRLTGGALAMGPAVKAALERYAEYVKPQRLHDPKGVLIHHHPRHHRKG
ncbi:MAG: hypothetical protein ACYS9X_21405, partial [Planctomycetota bacterium]